MNFLSAKTASPKLVSSVLRNGQRAIGCLVLWMGFAAALWGQAANAEKRGGAERKIKVLPIPALGYSPETKTYFGAIGLFNIDWYQDSITRKSNAKVEFNYTLNQQLVLEQEWNYFSKAERWFTDGLIHTSEYPDFYYGVGANTSAQSELLFASIRSVVRLGLYRNMGRQVFLGGGIRYVNFEGVTPETLGLFQEVKDGNNVGIRAAVFQDSRNNLLNPTKGHYYLVELEQNFSRRNYFIFKLDLRKYHQFQSGFVFSNRIYNSFVTNRPNFYDYSMIGGDRLVRGYLLGRYRNNHVSTVQTELRTPMRWKMGLAFIGGISSVYDDWNTFYAVAHPNYGLGLRVLMDQKDNVNFRVDYVLGDGSNSGLYISFGESF
ncbi:MAG: BamA/TamA family outer membrane protein [Salibacteraceae bacterium]